MAEKPKKRARKKQPIVIQKVVGTSESGLVLLEQFDESYDDMGDAVNDTEQLAVDPHDEFQIVGIKKSGGLSTTFTWNK